MFTYLFQDDENSTARYGYRKIFKKPLKEVWVSHNVFQCRCMNNEFIDFLQDDFNTKVCVEFFLTSFFNFTLADFVQNDQQFHLISRHYALIKKCLALFSGH